MISILVCWLCLKITDEKYCMYFKLIHTQCVLSLGNFRSISNNFIIHKKVAMTRSVPEECDHQSYVDFFPAYIMVHQNHPGNFKICESWSRIQSWQQNILHHDFCPCREVENIWLLFMFCLNFFVKH